MSPSDINPLELSEKRPDWCAKVPLSISQRVSLYVFLLAAIAALVLRPFATARLFVLLSSLFYLAITLYKLGIISASVRKNAIYRFSPDDLARAESPTQDPTRWPIYSVLVPMYKEPEVIPQMVRGLMAMDYPTDRLDVQLLLEEDDEATLAAARATPMPPNFRVTVIPPSFPRTKPKACNIGLGLAKGEFLVIYDAEDRPEPDQLKKAVLAFEAAGPKVACVQSCLNFYNPRQNLLTRFFTGDYSAWFDLQLPGLAARKAVIPLGGTSNHFRTSILRDLLGWDAYNVTEDCDLGVRLCRAGYTTAMVETTTWEEACSSVPFWIRQRTRWIKGYIQTWFVHMRNPIRLLRELGPRNFLHFQALVGGVCLSFLLNPIFWVLALLWFLVRPAGIDRLFPGPVFAIGAFCLFAGNFLFVYTILLGCYRRNQDRLLWANLLAPLYWVLMSIAGWRAFIQFFRNPFLWEKTQHALGSSAPKGTPVALPTTPAPSLPTRTPPSASPTPEEAPSKTQPIPVVEDAATPAVPTASASLLKAVLPHLLLFLILLTGIVFLSAGTPSSEPFYTALRAQISASTTCGRQALIGSSFWAPLPNLIGAFAPNIASILPALLAAATLFFGLRWLFKGTLSALIPLAFCLAGTLLCGFTVWGYTATGILLLFLGVLFHKRHLLRFIGTSLIGILPSIYTLLVWLLLSALILQDATYFLRPLSTVTQADLPTFFLRPVQDPRTPLDDSSPLLTQALAIAHKRSPYARIFICGYEGLAEINSLPQDSQHTLPITPVLDLHLSELRTAYKGQVHYLLVKNPQGPGRFESHSIRYPDLYEYGIEGSIYAADFGPWRLYELIATDGL